MTKPSNFIQSTDYMSIGSDGRGEISVTVPASTVLSSSTISVTFETTANVGTKIGSNFRTIGKSSKDSNWVYGTSFYTINTGVAGPPVSSNWRRCSAACSRAACCAIAACSTLYASSYRLCIALRPVV